MRALEGGDDELRPLLVAVAVPHWGMEAGWAPPLDQAGRAPRGVAIFSLAMRQARAPPPRQWATGLGHTICAACAGVLASTWVTCARGHSESLCGCIMCAQDRARWHYYNNNSPTPTCTRSAHCSPPLACLGELVEGRRMGLGDGCSCGGGNSSDVFFAPRELWRWRWP